MRDATGSHHALDDGAVGALPADGCRPEGDDRIAGYAENGGGPQDFSILAFPVVTLSGYSEKVTLDRAMVSRTGERFWKENTVPAI